MTERDIFIAALQKETSAERQALLDEACAGRHGLRAAVEGLLRLYENAGSFLELPARAPAAPAPFAAAGAPEEAGPGTSLGPFQLIEPIGEGGMGTVWLAQQTEPVKRQVALKVINPGLDSRQFVARFEAERQALAIMDHPNIARVLDAGTTPAGRPFFVMELVQGVPLTRYCDEHRLTPRQRLELFVPVCQAVQHAHQKGVIHRDLKPSNVLVACYDGKPVPKVIDFGVAKAAGQPLTEKTLVTGFGAVVGTLAYMSPEQAELNPVDIDTRSDVYSLGVLLYELLTDTTPLERERLKGAALLEVLRLIREEEPPRPSARLSTVGRLPSIAANRGLEPKRLSGLVRGELDWIVMKCLEKDRNRRYETAIALAWDLQRYLADEPVLACPPSSSYRLRKFVRRNWRALATAALLGVMLLVVAGSLGWVARDRAARREETARGVRDSLARARRLLEEEKLAAARQEQAVAWGRLGDDRAALADLADEVAVLKTALEKHDRFLALVNEGHQAEIPAWVVLTLELHGPDPPRATREPVTSYGRLPARAVPLLRQALAQYHVLERDDWLDALQSSPLGPRQASLIRRIVYEEAVWLADDVLSREQDHGSGAKLSKEAAARQALAYLRIAEASLRPTTALYRVRALCHRALGEEEAANQDTERARRTPPQIALDHYLLGLAAYDVRDKAEAVKQFEAALHLDPTHYWSMMRLGGCLAYLGRDQHDYAGAVMAYTGCIFNRPQHAMAYFGRGNSYRKLRRNQEAIADLTRAIELDAQLDMAWNSRGVVYMALDQPAKALADFAKALELDPADATRWNNYGAALGKLGQHEKSLLTLNKAIDLDAKHAAAWGNRAVAHMNLRQPEKAMADFARALELAPRDAMYWRSRAVAHAQLGQHLQAVEDYSRAIQRNSNHAQTWNNRGKAFGKLGQHDKALADFSKAIELDPNFALAWANRGLAYYHMNLPDKAVLELCKALDLDPHDYETWSKRGAAYAKLGQMDKALADYSKALELNGTRAGSWFNRGSIYAQMGLWEKATADYSKALDLDPKDSDIRFLRGQAYADQRQWAKAIEDFSGAIQGDPNRAEIWHRRGAAHWNLGELQEAKGDYSKAIELDPKVAQVWHNRGLVHKKLGDHPRALHDYSKALELNPQSVATWYNRGVVYLHIRQWDKALIDNSKAVELDPRHRAAWANRGLAHEHLGRLPEALADFSRAIELDPRYAMALNNRGVIYAKLKQLDKALADYTRAIEIDAKSPGTWHNRGDIYLRQGQWRLALADFSKALDLRPGHAFARTGRGMANAALGHWEKSVADLAAVIETRPPSEPWFQLAALHVLRGDAAGYQKVGSAMLERVNQAKNPSAVFYGSRACILTAKGLTGPRRAVQWAEQALVSRPREGRYLHVLGMAHYRAGQFDLAIRRCHESLKAEPHWTGHVLNWLTLAMSHHALGQTASAQEWAAKAAQWRQRIPDGQDKIVVCPSDLQLSDWMEALVLLSEARALIPSPGEKKGP
jgi:tetratricopeptide (TPR) repeat protein